MDTNKSNFQRYLDNISDCTLSYKIQNGLLLLLHTDFVAEIDLKNDKMTVFTLDRQRISEIDIELLYDLSKNIGLITTLAQDFAINIYEEEKKFEKSLK